MALQQELGTYIHGIEIDTAEAEKCKHRLSKAAGAYGVCDVEWNILNADTLAVSRFDGQMDFVFGNPPYVRIHNLKSSSYVRKYSFANKGMTDLYLVFYEIGFKMLRKENGVMCLITPASWLNTRAGVGLRNYILEHKNLVELLILGHHQPFEGVTTYTLIALFRNKERSEVVRCGWLQSDNLNDTKSELLPYSELYIGGNFYVAPSASLNLLNEVKKHNNPTLVKVKNGFATLADKVFIGQHKFSGLQIKVVKSSTGKESYALFPYDNNYEPIPLGEIKEQHPDVYHYITLNEGVLTSRNYERHTEGAKAGEGEESNAWWHLYGRSQAIQDVYQYKVAVSSLVKDINSLKITPAPSGVGVYGGIYILCDESLLPFIEQLLRSQEYIEYVTALGSHKSGGYYTINTRNLEDYLNYKLWQERKIGGRTKKQLVQRLPMQPSYIQ